ncbi:MAG TPA: histidine kinase [Chloroflexota bacterium]|nr:histidine kinase [Chloroflexota bacterium]
MTGLGVDRADQSADRDAGGNADATRLPYLYGPSLFWRLLVANLVVVLGGALLGTTLTRLFVLSGRFTPLTHALMVLVAIGLSAALTAFILRIAFRPLRDLRRAIQESKRGVTPAAPRLTAFDDPDVAAVAREVHALWRRQEEHVRLLEEKTAQLERTAALVVAAQEEERRRLARELHDGTMQSIAALVMGLERGAQAMPPDVPHLAESHRAVSRLRDVAAQTLDEVRQLALNLRPAVLDDHGLPAALGWLAQTHEERTGKKVGLERQGEVEERLLPEAETALFRIAQEALANVAKHAEAEHVTLRYVRRNGTATLEVEDDGVGMGGTNGRASGHVGMGLFSMRERAALLGGECTIGATESGRGTLVRARVPVQAQA